MDFQVNLRNVLEVNEVSQICTLETTIRMFWTDWRVKLKQSGLQSELSYVTLNPSAADMFWIPGIVHFDSLLRCLPTTNFSLKLMHDCT